MAAMRILFGILLAFFIVPVCNAQGKPTTVFGGSASELVAKCKNISVADPGGKGDSSDLYECMGYICGVVDAPTIASRRNESGAFSACIPESVSKGQLVRIYLKYADNHPERLHLVAAIMVIEALEVAFPCAAPK
jgi:Rap1a immunity proteins